MVSSSGTSALVDVRSRRSGFDGNARRSNGPTLARRISSEAQAWWAGRKLGCWRLAKFRKAPAGAPDTIAKFLALINLAPSFLHAARPQTHPPNGTELSAREIDKPGQVHLP